MCCRRSFRGTPRRVWNCRCRRHARREEQHLLVSNKRMRSASPRRRRRRWPQRSRLNWRRMTRAWRKNNAALESALQVDPDHGTARWPSSTPASLSSCGSEAARSSAGRTSQRRRSSTSRRSNDGNGECLRVIAVSHLSSPTTRTQRRSISRYSPRSSSGLSRAGKRAEAKGLHLRLFL